jgi:hypothetical protein
MIIQNSFFFWINVPILLNESNPYKSNSKLKKKKRKENKKNLLDFQMNYFPDVVGHTCNLNNW